MKLGIIPPNTKACPNGGIPELSNEFLVFDHVTKRFGALTAVNDVSFSVNKGEFFSLLGPSGCGKTTLLRMLGGFEKPDSGRIFLEGKDITDLAPNERRVHTVFQNYALFPTMTIWDNIAFSLRLAKLPKKEIEEKVDAILDMIQMSEHAWKYPNQLSGGQKQRVAIARALVDRPKVLLLDEPLAALDLKLRQHMLLELDTIHDQVGITFMYVTHDQGEAMSLSDRIASRSSTAARSSSSTVQRRYTRRLRRASSPRSSATPTSSPARSSRPRATTARFAPRGSRTSAPTTTSSLRSARRSISPSAPRRSA